ncbi:hypothetical protein GARC_1149 [Paraglaciecola arctica BSs20135]|uniref:Flagellar hook-length control protein-like C-terminal domain-containing protein n=1 Tax=Paraglaciecola arctica BSs20135 TaxID=493475 RepID=K6XBW5_9ALTE|nr:hypothetical protein GARC_1149 [Paraglaciecola arctica BSs20135]
MQSLLRLPAKQLIPSNLLVKSDTTNTLPVLNATVLAALTKGLPNTQIPSELIKPQTATSPIQTQQNTLRVSLTDQKPAIELALPVKQLNQFTVGEKVSLSLAPKGNNWQLTIVQNKMDLSNQPKSISEDKVQLRNQLSTSALPTQLAPNKIASQLLAQTNVTATQTNSNSEMRVVKDQQSLLTPILATPIIKASLGELKLDKSASFELPIKPVLQQLSKINNEQNQALIQKLQALPIDKISLQIKPSGEIGLLVQNTKPVATIVITKEIAQALAPLKLPNQLAVMKELNLSIENSKLIQTPVQTTRSEVSPKTQRLGTENLQQITADNKTRPIVPPVDGTKSPETRLSMQEAASNLQAQIQERPLAQSVISQSLLANKPEQINLVQSLLRIVQAKAEAPAITLQSIEKALVDGEFFKGVTEQPSKQLVEQVLQQIKQALPQGKEQDVNQIRQLLTTPALNLSALQMINPTSSQGFMSGLITLLQMSLSARLTRIQTSRTEHITETLNNVLSGTSKAKPSVSSKAMGEMSQLEQRHQLMKEIGRLLSGHQTSKLSNAEQMIQGQESFYYNLPTAFGGTIKDIELLIKREDNDKEDQAADEQSNKTWQLTMKLAVGELGELLTKAKLRSDTLEINFYASNEAVKIQVMNYLPLLRRKFDSLGIEVSKSHCQLGKIPDTLQQRPYHMFQAKA